VRGHQRRNAAAGRWDAHPALLAAVLLAMTTGCAAETIVVRDDLSQAHRIVAPPCTAPTSRVEVLKVRPEPARTSSLNVERLLVDLRVQVRDPRQLWLLVGDDMFPSGVSEVSRSVDDDWRFVGTTTSKAKWLGPTTDVTFTNRQVARGWTPFILGVIEVDGVTPLRWVQQGGRFDSRTSKESVPARIDVVCATWIDLRDTP
jgi:hypothetical protein